MKKSLIALAVLGLSGAAMAQSSVTLYGVADAGLGKIKTNPPATDANNKTQFISSSLMNNGNSRIGLRGIEDLGGGASAGFQFETGINLNDGSSAQSGPGLWSRAAKMWLSGNWGTFQMGRTLNPTFLAAAAWDLTGMANYTITNVYSTGPGGGRTSSQFSYKTPDVLGGLTAELAYVFKSDNSNKARWDLNVIYKNGPIVASLGANKNKGDKTTYVLGGRYSFSNFNVAASYTRTTNALALKRQGFTIGGSAVFGAASVTLELSRDSKNEWSGGKKYTNGMLEGKYALSKRTFLYAAYLRLDDNNNYGIGVRHNF